LAETIRSLTNALALMVPGVLAGTTCQDVRDILATIDGRAGGVASIKEDTGIVGDGATAQATAIADKLDDGGIFRVPTGNYLFGSAPGRTVALPLVLRGVGDGSSIFNRGSAASGAIMFNVVSPGSLDVRDMSFIEGAAWFDMDANTGVIDRIIVKGSVFTNVSCGVRNLTTSPNAAAKIGHFRYQDNRTKDNTRGGPAIDANGTTHGIVTGNLIEDTARFGIALFGRASSQTSVLNDRNIVANNILRGLTISTAPNNFIYLSGRYGIVANNHCADFVFNGDPNATDVEGIYLKCINAIVMGNTLKNASGGSQGALVLKGNGRPPIATSGARGYNNIAIANIIANESSQFNTPDGIWIQAEDCLCAFNMMEGLTGNGFRIHDAVYKNTGILFNHFVNHVGGTPVNALGANPRLRIMGNLVERNAGPFLGNIDTAGEGDIDVVMVHDNLAFSQGDSGSVSAFIQMDSQGAGESINGFSFQGNVADGQNQTSGYDFIRLNGAGTYTDVLIAGNIFKDGGAGQFIKRQSGTCTGTFRIPDSNLGFANWTKGSAQIDSATSSEIVAHGQAKPTGFSTVRNEWEVKIIPTSPLVTAHSWAVSAIDDDDFTVTTYDSAGAPVNVGANFTFDWEMYKREWALA
jgi:hypothetical protein